MGCPLFGAPQLQSGEPLSPRHLGVGCYVLGHGRSLSFWSSLPRRRRWRRTNPTWVVNLPPPFSTGSLGMLLFAAGL